MTTHLKQSIAVLTSGGDAPGMNAAVRAVVRTALSRNVDAYVIYEGYYGMVQGGRYVRKADWDLVGGILHRGGTVIGTARCEEFRSREGRLMAAHSLIKHRISNLIVIGGDGSLTGANLFREEWLSLLVELVDKGDLDNDLAQAYANLKIVGLVGSIDNDMFGTDMTIGTDTALHRITEAVDAIASTASSHQRTFVVEVMGRNCGYLALMSGLAAGAGWILIPESPPNVDNWEDKMCEVLRMGREAGRRNHVVIVAEGACDRHGQPITSDYVKQTLQDRLGEDTRVTILGHVQRGGSPSAFDRNLGTILGHTAVDTILSMQPTDEPLLIGISGNEITQRPLMECVKKTHEVAKLIAAKSYTEAMDMRGGSFREAFRTLRTMVRAFPHPPPVGQQPKRFGILNAGGPAAGMNTAVRVAVRACLDKGHTILGVMNGFSGLIKNDLREMDWMSVNGWVSQGGAQLGTRRYKAKNDSLYAMARTIEAHKLDGLLLVGGWSAYSTGHLMHINRHTYPAFDIPIVYLPASISNNLPGTEISIGADTALNNIIGVVDKIKESAVASHRCFVVEVMGRYCGYLALMSGLATGAEQVYLHEEGVTLETLQTDLGNLMEGFAGGKRLALMIRNEYANAFYTTDFLTALFDEESGDLFDVRKAILGHLQQGGRPSPFDRIQATRFAVRCVDFLIEQANEGRSNSAFIGLQKGKITLTDLEQFPHLVDQLLQRPKDQWWLTLAPIAQTMGQPNPNPS